MSIEFLVKVLPWPGEGEPGYINIHWIERDRKGMSGRPCQTPARLYETRDRYSQDKKPRDFYICLSLQSSYEDKVSRSSGHKYRAATRLRENVLALKSLYIDVDEKNYPDPKSLLLDFQRFRKETELPFPSAIVHSGGGYHFYWAFNRHLTLGEWQPLANALSNAIKKHALKADTQCTVDAARVLRLPATYNYKYDPPRKVELKHLSDTEFMPEFVSGKLAPYHGVLSEPATSAYFVNGALPPRTPILSSDLAKGIDAPPAYLVPASHLTHECPLFVEALKTGGAAYANPLWNLTTLLATFMEDGNSLAHLMARKHPTYTKEDTDALYARKEKEKADRNLGWPTCKAFSDAGSTPCQTCPHLAAGKSPLNFAKKNGVATRSNQLPPRQDITIPGYVYAEDQRFYRVGTSKDDPSVEVRSLVYERPIVDWNLAISAQDEPFVQFRIPLVNRQPIKLPFNITGSFEMRKTLQGQGMMMSEDEAKEVGRFMPKFIQALQDVEKEASVKIVPSGWNTDAETGEIDGFSFNGVCYGENKNRRAPLLGGSLQAQYTPHGSARPWQDLASCFIQPDRHAVNTIISAAAAGPLVHLSGHQGLILSAYSPESGKGKSTAARMGQAMMGDPSRGVNQLDDTTNSVIDKLSSLGSLTCYFDESRFSTQGVDAIFRYSAGKAKARLTNTIVQRDVGKWNTLIVPISNEGLIYSVDKRVPALLRTLEFTVKDGETKDIASFIDVTALTSKLDDNYGHFGLEYAPFLAKNWRNIITEVKDAQERVRSKTAATKEERFWVAIIACVTLGAKYINQLGWANFDIEGQENFLIAAMEDMRRLRTSETLDVTDADSMYLILSDYVKSRRQNTIKLEHTYLGSQTPKPKILNHAEFVGRATPLHVQLGDTDLSLRISEADFRRYCAQEKHNFITVREAFKELLGMTVILSGRLGGGTEMMQAGERLWAFDMTKWNPDKVMK